MCAEVTTRYNIYSCTHVVQIHWSIWRKVEASYPFWYSVLIYTLLVCPNKYIIFANNIKIFRTVQVNCMRSLTENFLKTLKCKIRPRLHARCYSPFVIPCRTDSLLVQTVWCSVEGRFCFHRPPALLTLLLFRVTWLLWNTAELLNSSLCSSCTNIPRLLPLV
jgi:hypothetical protein